MPIDFRVVQGAYLRDLLDQPNALEATLDGFRDLPELRSFGTQLKKGHFKSVVLTGMGSSFHALNPILLQLLNAGYQVHMVETSELIYYRRSLLNAGALVLAVSQSGRSAELIRLLEENRGRATILAVTNTAESPLTKRARAVVLTRAGEEFSVSCKTYVSTLIALKYLGDQLCGVPFSRTQKDLRDLLNPFRRHLSRWQEHVRSMVPGLKPVRQIFIAGRGASLAAVGTGALIVKESVQVPAEGLSSAAFRHGPFEMLGTQTLVLVFAGDRKTKNLNRRLFRDIQTHKGQSGFVDERRGDGPYDLPRVAPSLLPVLEILPIQMLTLALAIISGTVPGQFRFATKVTTTE
jgi:glutamine---fructose-6-phosphate transaminase (isomerizing)